MVWARRWSRAYAVTAVVGVAVALIQWSPPLVLALAMVGMVPAMVGLSLQAQTKGHRPGALSGTEIRRLMVRSAYVAAGLVAACAYVAVSPLLAITLVLALAVTSPRLGLLGRRTVEDVEHSGSHDADAESVHQLSVAELCQRWCRTFHGVLQHDPHHAARIVGMRQLYLDEMERRDPAGLRSWLMSSPHAGGSPEKYLAAQRDPDVT